MLVDNYREISGLSVLMYSFIIYIHHIDRHLGGNDVKFQSILCHNVSSLTVGTIYEILSATEMGKGSIVIECIKFYWNTENFWLSRIKILRCYKIQNNGSVIKLYRTAQLYNKFLFVCAIVTEMHDSWSFPLYFIWFDQHPSAHSGEKQSFILYRICSHFLLSRVKHYHSIISISINPNPHNQMKNVFSTAKKHVYFYHCNSLTLLALGRTFVISVRM